MWPRLIKRLIFKVSLNVWLHHGPDFGCSYLIPRGFFKKSLKEEKCLISTILNFLTKENDTLSQILAITES